MQKRMQNKRRMTKAKSKKTQIKLKQILILSVLVVLILLADAYRRGDVLLYRGKDVSSGTPSKQKKDGNTIKTAKEKQESPQDDSCQDGSRKTGQADDCSKIRVLLSTTGFGSYYHEQVVITSTKGMTVSRGKVQEYPAGKEFSVSLSEMKQGKIVLRPASGSRLKLLSVTRQNRHPGYRGTLELKRTEQGWLLINELMLGEYLYAVVPSELSTGSNIEALKAQAVCARTYAYGLLQSDRYEEYGADIDDTTSCQVYNNIPEDARSRQAVRATAGEVLAKDGKPASAYYYSTSWGKSASGKEVWDTPSDISYLQSCMQTVGQESGDACDLSEDAAFRRFLQDDSHPTYDSGSAWYRWRVKIPASSLSQRVDALLEQCYQADSSRVLTQTASGAYRSKALKPIGKIRKLRVEKRGKSGLVTELVLVGTENVLKVCTQYNIRKVLSPGSAKIQYGAGKTTMSMLPSAAFYLDDITESDGSLSFEIHGGGFGHGTGMSQCGAVSMAEQGKGYQDILRYYFSGCEVAAKSISK